MNNKRKSFKKIIQKNDTFIFWTLLVLSIDYLALFFIESILPRYVINYFNLNLLLVFLLISWLVFSFTSKFKLPKSQKQQLQILINIFLIGLFFIGAYFTLYKLAPGELLISISLLSVIGFYLYKKMF